MAESKAQANIFRQRKCRILKHCQRVANFDKHNYLSVRIEKNGKGYLTKEFKFSEQLAANKEAAPLTSTKAINSLITSCELLAQASCADIKVTLIVIERGVQSINTIFKKIQKPNEQVGFDLSPINVQPEHIEQEPAEPLCPIQTYLIKKLRTLPDWFQPEPAVSTDTPRVSLATIDDCIAAQQTDDGQNIVHLLLNNISVYDEVPTRLFVREFNNIVRNYYYTKYGLGPDNYHCLKMHYREIRFLSSRRRTAFFQKILKQPPKPDDPEDKKDFDKLKFQLDYQAKNDPVNSNSVLRIATHLNIKYWRALKILNKYGVKKYKIHTAPALTQSHKNGRVKFALDVLNENKSSENDEYLRKIWYSDECHVALRCPNIKNLWHWGTERPDCLEITQSAANYVSVWAAVNADHKTELYFLEKPKVGVKGPLYYKGPNGTQGLPKMENVTVNSQYYVEDILSRFREDLDRLGFIKDGKLFDAIYMQDG